MSKIFASVTIGLILVVSLLIHSLQQSGSISSVYGQSASTTVIRGVNYNPIAVGSTNLDFADVLNDVAGITALHANTIGLYNCGLFDWGKYINSTVGRDFCRTIYPIALKNNLGVVVGYFSNASVNWTNSKVRTRLTAQFQSLVKETKDLSTTKGYLIGNEVFEQLPDENARIAYARWIGSLVDWEQKTSPQIPVYYADNSQLYAFPYLQKYAPHLTVYAINTYEWSNASELISIVDNITNRWGKIQVLLHEWGSDSFDTNQYKTDELHQSQQITYLASEIEKAQAARPDVFIGALLFEYTDDFSKLGNPGIQDSDQGAWWTCNTCFDLKANEEFWGIKNKPAESTLSSFWSSLK